MRSPLLQTSCTRVLSAVCLGQKRLLLRSYQRHACLWHSDRVRRGRAAADRKERRWFHLQQKSGRYNCVRVRTECKSKGYLRHSRTLSLLSLRKSIFVNFWHLPSTLFCFRVVPVFPSALSGILLPWLICQRALQKSEFQSCLRGEITSTRTSIGVINSKGFAHCVCFVCTL